MSVKGWVKTTFEKEFIEGDRALCNTVQTFGHGVTINYKPEWDYLVYGDLDAYNARNVVKGNPDSYIHPCFNVDGTVSGRVSSGGEVNVIKVNPDDRYKRQTD